MVTFDEVIGYVCDFDPDFAGSIEAASVAEMAELERLRDAETPAVYRDFLATMGRSIGWLDIRRLDFGIDAVLAYYQAENWLPADEFLRIGTDPADPPFHPHLELSQFSDEADVIVIRESDAGAFEETRYDGGRFQLAGSLQEMICMPVFEMFEMSGPGRRPAKRAAARWVHGAIEAADALTRELGFEPLFWSSEAGRGYRRADAAMQLRQLRGFPLEVAIRADSEAEQARLVAQAEERLGVG